MKYRPLGRTGFDVSTVSFGAWAIGDAWGKVDDDQSRAALHRALDLGINFFDTADVYSTGVSEEVTGRALKDLGPREQFVIATKPIRPRASWTAVTGGLLRLLRSIVIVPRVPGRWRWWSSAGTSPRRSRVNRLRP